MIGLYALSFWVPRILTTHGVTLRRLGWATALPSVFGAAGMLLWSRLSDGSTQRKHHLAAAFLLAAIGITTAALSPSQGAAWPLAGFSAAGIGVLAAMPIFWASLSQQLTPTRAAVAIAAVNSVGNLGGFLGPYAMGWMLKTTHQFRPGLLATAACLLTGAALTLLPTPQTLRAPFIAAPPR
jgi:ACS family tartrate transporter-like MFS transporter